MQIIVGIIGIISLISAILHLFFPDFLAFLNALGRDMVLDMSAVIQKHRVVIGIFYLIGGIYMVYIGFFYR